MSFLQSYMDWHRRDTEAPDVFGEYMALGILGAAIGRRRWHEEGSRRYYPNLWILLVAPSTSVRKSTAVNSAVGMYVAACSGIVYPDEFSGEALTAILAQSPSGIFSWPEYAATARQLDRDYASAVKPMLTNLWDTKERHVRETVGRDPIVIEWPAITILAASVGEWLRQHLQEGDVEGGWLARFCIVPAESSERDIPFAEGDRSFWSAAMMSLRATAATPNGPIVFGSAAREVYSEWYGPHKRRGNAAGTAGPALARLQVVCKKLAMIYSIDRGALQVEAEDVLHAIVTTDWLAGKAEEFYGSGGAATGKDAANQRRIAEYLASLPTKEAEEAVLLEKTGLSQGQLEFAMRTLSAKRRVTKVIHDAQGDRPRESWYVLMESEGTE